MNTVVGRSTAGEGPVPEADGPQWPANDHAPVPFAVPDIGEAEVAAVTEALRSGWVTSGPRMAAFEEEFAAFMGGGVEAVATNSATAGLHLALEACGVGPGDEVIVPTWTFTATAEVVQYVGATPVLVDVDPHTLHLDLQQVEAAATSRTAAVIPVHMAGLGVDLARLAAITAPRGIHIIEDAAHALPTTTGGRLVGSRSWSTAAVFSFYATKTITTGEGGMVTTPHPDIAERIRIMRLHGIDRDVFRRYRSARPSWSYDVVAPGFKYNMPDTAAALGRVQLGRAQQMREQRAAVASRYAQALAGLPLELPPEAPPGELHAWHLYVVKLSHDAPVGRDRFIARMARAGVNCSVHFIPLHELSYWRNSLRLGSKDFPQAAAVSPRAVSLPLFSAMTPDQVERVIQAVGESLT